MKSLLLLPVALTALLASRPDAACTSCLLPPPADWTVDTVHSSAVFRIKHTGTSFFYGTFGKTTGTVALDPKAPASGKIAIEIVVDSIHTHDKGRDQHLLGPDFFDAKQYPVMKFTSDSIAAAGADAYEVKGTLQLHGKSQPLTVKVQKTGEGEMRGQKRIGFETTFTIKRSDFGMEYGLAQQALGDEVQVTLSVPCVPPKG